MPFDLGTDFDVNGDLTETGDLKTVTGTENVTQSVERLIKTLPGVYSFVWDPYGNEALRYFGMDDNIQNRAFMALLFEETAKLDPRVYDASCAFDISTKQYTLIIKIINEDNIDQIEVLEGEL